MQSITANFRRAGARLIVVATVVETVDDLERTAAAVATTRILHVRLTASPDAFLSRLTRRHNDAAALRSLHTQRHTELAGILDRAGFTNDLWINTTDRPVADIAREILTAIVQ